MSIWGKLIGGGTGLLLGGPLGAVLGLAVGHGVDSIRKSDKNLLEAEDVNSENPSAQYQDQKKQSAFALGVIVLAAKLSKADGKVTQEEIDTFKKVFEFDIEDQVTIGKIYNEAKLHAEGYEAYAEQLVNVFQNQKELYVELINSLYKIAFSDGYLHENEELMIRNISLIFGMPNGVVDSIKAQYSKQEPFNLDREYKVLGLNSSFTDAEIKKRYHNLVKKYHPDYLLSKGLPEEFLKLANEKLSSINQSYEMIIKDRKMKNK